MTVITSEEQSSPEESGLELSCANLNTALSYPLSSHPPLLISPDSAVRYILHFLCCPHSRKTTLLMLGYYY